MTLPAWLTAVLPSSTVRAWSVLADLAPEGSYLGGGTAIAVHLRHRVSRDLDLFLRHPVDLMALVDQVRRRGDLVVSRLDLDEGAQTLNAVFHQTRVQVLEASSLGVLEPTIEVERLPVAGLGDLLAMKLKVLLDRRELRDYFDLLSIERDGGRTVEEGIGLALAKYRPAAEPAFVTRVLLALGHLDDVEDDPGVPLPTSEVADYWRGRVPQVARSLRRGV